MLRYIALSWNPSTVDVDHVVKSLTNHLIRASPLEWQLVLSGPGLAVWYSGAEEQLVRIESPGHSRGVVLGHLFGKNGRPVSGAPFARRVDELSREVNDSRGRKLSEQFWGGYISILTTEAGCVKQVIRDPTGNLPCFFLHHENVTIYFSDIKTIESHASIKLTCNLDYIVANAHFPKLQKTLTGLVEVSEVLPGQSRIVTRTAADTQFIWSPYDFIDGDRLTSVQDAAQVIYTATASTVETLARSFGRVTHNLGGLDSSIILSFLADAYPSPDIGCINYYTASPRGDERMYAQAMAARYGVSLRFAELRSERVRFDDIVRSAGQVSPMSFFDFLDVAGDLYGSDDIRKTDALFYGVGGDSVFMQSPSIFPALDFVTANGFLKSTKVIMDSLKLSRRSLTNVIGEVAREVFARRDVFDHIYGYMLSNVRRPGLSDDVANANPSLDLLHPLLRPRSDLKGDYFRILASCFMSVEYYDQFHQDHQVEKVHVFLSQPVIEAGLRIPSWIMTLSGVDRGLARKAFRHRLPDLVVRRMTKGTPDEIYEEVLHRDRQEILAYLIDGALVRSGVLCRESLQKMLSLDSVEAGELPHNMLDYLNWEAWMQKWMSRSSCFG